MGSFDDVDRSDEADALVEWMERQRAGASARQAQLLDARPGERVLDLGCGPGADLGYFTEAVADGLAVGADRSSAMAETAASAGRVICSNAALVGLRSGQFDAVWLRAVLLHVPSPPAVLDEVARLLRPGGRVVVAEPDHGTHVVGPCDPDLFDRIRAHRLTKFQNPRVGRSLKSLLVNAGFEAVRGQPAVLHFEDLALARAAGGPFDRAVTDAIRDGAISQGEGDRYLNQLAAANDRGSFFFAAVSVVATGRRPR